MNGNPGLSLKPEPPLPSSAGAGTGQGVRTSQWILQGQRALPASLSKQAQPSQSTGWEARAVPRHFELASDLIAP